jgi:hypothetical protein
LHAKANLLVSLVGLPFAHCIHASDTREAMITTRIAPQPVASERRRLEARRLVVELATRLRWPPVIVAVTIPPELVAMCRTVGEVIDPDGYYEVERGGGWLEVEGPELVVLCSDLAALADAQTTGDETAVWRALGRLSDPRR